MRKRQVIIAAVSIVLVGCFLWSANSAHAELISAVTNPSFESPLLGNGKQVADIPNWEETSSGLSPSESTYQRDPSASETPGPTDGLQVALLILRKDKVTECRVSGSRWEPLQPATWARSSMSRPTCGLEEITPRCTRGEQCGCTSPRTLLHRVLGRRLRRTATTRC